MKRRILEYWLIGTVLVLPNVGCLSWLHRDSNPLIPPLGDTAQKTQKEETLPPDKSAENCFTVARTMQANGHLKEAASQYEMARLYDPNTTHVARRLAVIYDQLGNHLKAEAEYQKALAENPKDANLLNNYGYFHHNRGKWDEAETLFLKAIKIQPKNKYAWSNLGLVRAMKKDYPGSLEAYKKAVSEAEAFNNLAFALQTHGEFEKAKMAYREALKREPSWEDVRIRLEKLERGINDIDAGPAMPPGATSHVRPEPPLTPIPLPDKIGTLE